jgi:non-heme chloroperoxidase
MIFHNYVSNGISDWIYKLGLDASSWATSAIANTWLGEEELFNDLEKINAPTIILHGLNDRVCLYQLALAQKDRIKNAKLVPFDCCGHFLFYDQLKKFNSELIRFIEE